MLTPPPLQQPSHEMQSPKVLDLDDQLQLQALIEILQLLQAKSVTQLPVQSDLRVVLEGIRLRAAYLLRVSRKPPSRSSELDYLAAFHHDLARALRVQQDVARIHAASRSQR